MTCDQKCEVIDNELAAFAVILIRRRNYQFFLTNQENAINDFLALGNFLEALIQEPGRGAQKALIDIEKSSKLKIALQFDND